MKTRHAVNIDDMAVLARRRLPRIAFDFIDGGVDGEDGLRRNRAAFAGYTLLPRYLVDVENRHQRVMLFGHEYQSPIGISPMGIAGFFRPGADLMLARAAAKSGVPYLMSSASCDSIEDAIKVAPDTTWFQVYGARDPDITRDMIRRARALNVRVLTVTIDTPVIGKRERNVRNGFTRPMKMTADVIMQGLSRPGWTLDYLRNGGIPMMQNWRPYVAAGAGAEQVADLYGSQTPAPGQTWEVIEMVRREWAGPLIIKGVLSPEDALRCRDLGADGLIVSNHGARQLDAAPASIDVLPQIVEAVGPGMQILIDSGIRRGSDIAKALCLGASAALFGRPAMFAVAAAGEDGAARALEIYRQELNLVMGMMGWSDVSCAGPGSLRDARGQPLALRSSMTDAGPRGGRDMEEEDQ
jgi:(S)-mandelate dehydrogenase